MTDAMLQQGTERTAESAAVAPRLGFVGVGWIGRNRLQALVASEQAEVAAVVDPDEASVRACQEVARDARVCSEFDELLSQDLDAVIAARFYGDQGAVMFENVNGSFYDFAARLCVGTKAAVLVEPPDAWFGRAAVEWARKLRVSRRFDPQAEEHIPVAAILDSIYGR